MVAAVALLGKALFHQTSECASGFVYLRPRTSPRGTLCLKLWRQTGGYHPVTFPLMMYRAVRLMRCGYGAMACYFPRFCKATAGVSSVSPTWRVLTTLLLRLTPFVNSPTGTRPDTSPSSTLLLASIQPLIVCGFFSPGGHADGVRRAGIHAVGIDIATNINEAKQFFEDVIPAHEPDSPLVTCVGGSNALSQQVRDEAVAAHPRTQEVMFGDFDPPPLPVL